MPIRMHVCSRGEEKDGSECVAPTMVPSTRILQHTTVFYILAYTHTGLNRSAAPDLLVEAS